MQGYINTAIFLYLFHEVIFIFLRDVKASIISGLRTHRITQILIEHLLIFFPCQINIYPIISVTVNFRKLENLVDHYQCFDRRNKDRENYLSRITKA